MMLNSILNQVKNIIVTNVIEWDNMIKNLVKALIKARVKVLTHNIIKYFKNIQLMEKLD